jgi:hypothetical protein
MIAVQPPIGMLPFIATATGRQSTANARPVGRPELVEVGARLRRGDVRLVKERQQPGRIRLAAHPLMQRGDLRHPGYAAVRRGRQTAEGVATHTPGGSWDGAWNVAQAIAGAPSRAARAVEARCLKHA